MQQQGGGSPWKARVQEIFQVCQEELKRTTEIGKRMISASKTNSSLHESYEELGMLAMKELKSGKLEWGHPRVEAILKMIAECEADLENIEGEVNEIRFSGENKEGKEEEE